MPFSDTPLNREVFQRVRWEEAIRESTEKECQRYSGLFFSKAKDAEAASDKEAQEAFTVLGGITSMMLNADSREESFSPMMVLSTGRSAALEDFTDNHLDALKAGVAETTDPELRARIADVIWCRKRDHRMAKLAVRSYRPHGALGYLTPAEFASIEALAGQGSGPSEQLESVQRLSS